MSNFLDFDRFFNEIVKVNLSELIDDKDEDLTKKWENRRYEIQYFESILKAIKNHFDFIIFPFDH